MIDNESSRSGEVHITDLPVPESKLVVRLVLFACAVGIAGVAIGFRMALHATLIQCPDGTSFPAGTTDFRCFAHEHAGVGTGLILISVMLIVLIVLAGICANALLTRRSLR